MIIKPMAAINNLAANTIEEKFANKKVSVITIGDARIYVNVLIELALKTKSSEFFIHNILFDEDVKNTIINELKEAGYTVTISPVFIKCYFPKNIWAQISNLS